MRKSPIQKIVPHLWYTKEAEEAARFYATVFPDSRVRSRYFVARRFAERARRPDRCRRVHAVWSGVHGNQRRPARLIRYWNALLENGGKPQACGWIIDRYGVRWQIVPTVLGDMITDPDTNKAKRVAEEMLRQVKFDIAKLEAAFQGS